jgi:hypothetical protein
LSFWVGTVIAYKRELRGAFCRLEYKICIRGIEILKGLGWEEVFVVKRKILWGLSGKRMAGMGTQRQKERE